MNKKNTWKIISCILIMTLLYLVYYFGYVIELENAVSEHTKLGFYSNNFAELQATRISLNLMLLLLVNIPTIFVIWQMPQDILDDMQKKVRRGT